MPLILLLVFLVVPVIEIAVFIQAGDLFGLWPTLAAILATAIAGAALLRRQGLATIRRANASLERGEMPVVEVFHGLCILAAGVLLLTPGFLTDAVGLLLFVPAVRRVGGGLLLALLRRRGRLHVWQPGPSGGPAGGGTAPRTIEGEYDVPDDQPRPGDPSSPSWRRVR